MAVIRSARGLMRKAVSATVSRERFSTGGSLIVAFAVGIIVIRCVSYPALVLVQYRHSNAALYFATCASSIAAAWAASMMFSMNRIRARSSASLFFHGMVSSTRVQRIWSLQLVVLRAGSIGLLGYIVVLLIAEAIRPQGHPWILLSMVAATIVTAIATVGVFGYVTRTIREETFGLSDTAALVVAVIAVAGPEFRIVDGTIVPLFFGIQISHDSLIPFTPLVAPFAIPLHIAARRVPIPEPKLLGSFLSRFPLVSVYLRRRSLGHWLAFMLVSGILSLLLRPLVIATLLATVGTSGWIAQSLKYVGIMRSDWIRNGRLTVIGREIGYVAVFSFMLYFLVAFIISALI